MEWWVIKEIENSSDDELKQREKVFFNLRSRKQAEIIIRVVRNVWQNKDVIEAVVKWTGKLTGAFAQGFLGGKAPQFFS